MNKRDVTPRDRLQPPIRPKTPLTALTERQIAALKYLIAKSPDASRFGKQLCFWLIDQSEGLTRSVDITINFQPWGQEASHAIHDMCSVNGKTQLEAILLCLDTKMSFVSYTDGDKGYCALKKPGTTCHILHLDFTPSVFKKVKRISLNVDPWRM